MSDPFPPDRPIRLHENGRVVQVIDQRLLPHRFEILDLETEADVIVAIQRMVVRGAPLIGVTAAWGLYLAALGAPAYGFKAHMAAACGRVRATRPTAVNLAWAVDRVERACAGAASRETLVAAALAEARAIQEGEAENGRLIGGHGLCLIRKAAAGKKSGEPVKILTHCNAGWLACVAHGTATAPMYAAHAAGIPIHVWVDETRPVNQGARLTAWELGRGGIPHTVIVDNAGGHLMQHGMVDMVIVGTDRTTCTGDVANKIGTYLKALAARDNGVPFYVALPSSTFDWTLRDGVKEIPIEERDPEEVRRVQGRSDETIFSVDVPPAETPVANPAFDVTPARLVTAFITERGICPATEAGIRRLFPEMGVC